MDRIENEYGIFTKNEVLGLTAEEVYQKWLESKDKQPKKEQITILKNELEESDYQIIKSYEYQLIGLEAPYDIETLHLERQAIRDKINKLEE